MASKYWLKLYYEILDDPKTARLPDSSWRRFIECLVLAGEQDEDGLLPSVEDMSWRLRVSETTMAQDMARLALAGLVELTQGDRWLVTNYAKRQEAVKGNERVRQFRERKRKEEYYGNEDVTIRYTDTDKIREDTDKTAPGASTGGGGGDYAHALESYQNNMGQLSPVIQSKIETACKAHGQQSVIDAIGISVENGVYKWAYVNAILDRWAVEGKQNGKATTSAAAAAWQRVMELAAKSELSQLTGIEREAAAAVGGDKLRGAKPERFKAQFMEAYDNAARKNNLQPTG